MEKSNVYLIVTDMHLSYRNKASRVDYLWENQFCINKLYEIVEKYENDYNTNIIFLGDFVDSSFKDQVKAVHINNLIVDLKRHVNECFFVIGNHETTYYRDNPVWTLFNDLESEELRKVVTKSCKPNGVLGLCRVPDILVDGEVTFYFNHHPTPIQTPNPGGINIGLFHKDIICNAILEDAKVNKDMVVFKAKPIEFDKSPIFTGYDYAFLGHMHSIYGTWDFTDDYTGYFSKLYYLASLGRTNHREVQDNFLERNIPAVIINNGKFECIEDNLFDLPDRKSCVVEKIIEKREEFKVVEPDYSYSANSDNPLNNVEGVLAMNASALHIFKEYRDNRSSTVENSIFDRMEEFEWL